MRPVQVGGCARKVCDSAGQEHGECADAEKDTDREGVTVGEQLGRAGGQDGTEVTGVHGVDKELRRGADREGDDPERSEDEDEDQNEDKDNGEDGNEDEDKDEDVDKNTDDNRGRDDDDDDNSMGSRQASASLFWID